MRYALVQDGVIVDVVIWNGDPSWSPPEGVELFQLAPEVPTGVGWAWDGAPVPPSPAPEQPAPSVADRLAAAGVSLDELKAALGIA